MNYFHKILLTCLFVLGVVTVSAEDKRDMFNPVRNSVTSQTIAPDARAAGMGDVGVAHNTGTLPNIRLLLVGLE